MSKGFTLLEVLIAVVIVAIGLLGITEAQLNALRQLRIQQTQQALLQQLANLSEALAMGKSSAMVIAYWEEQLQQTFPGLTIHIKPALLNCQQINLQWTQYQHNQKLEQTICEDSRA